MYYRRILLVIQVISAATLITSIVIYLLYAAGASDPEIYNSNRTYLLLSWNGILLSGLVFSLANLINSVNNTVRLCSLGFIMIFFGGGVLSFSTSMMEGSDPNILQYFCAAIILAGFLPIFFALRLLRKPREGTNPKQK